jgi:hypothetical protein
MQMLIKNPRERIPLTDMMRHPWVTMDGRFPLKVSWLVGQYAGYAQSRTYVHVRIIVSQMAADGLK